MNIAIIGAGNVGTALATSMTRAGHKVAISAADAANAQRAAEASGARAAQDNAAAVRDADVVVLAIPYVAAAEEVAKGIAPLVAGKVVIDVTNPIASDYRSLSRTGRLLRRRSSSDCRTRRWSRPSTPCSPHTWRRPPRMWTHSWLPTTKRPRRRSFRSSTRSGSARSTSAP